MTVETGREVEIGTKEIWESIEGFSGYEVSNLGHVRSQKYGYPSLMATRISERGYVRVPLRHDGRYVGKFVHVLVLEAFVGKRPRGHICKWKNGMRCDSKASNLSWVPRRDAGVISHPDGKAPTMAKLDVGQVREIFRSKAGSQDLAKRYGVSPSTIWKIRTGRSWLKVTDDC